MRMAFLVKFNGKHLIFKFSTVLKLKGVCFTTSGEINKCLCLVFNMSLFIFKKNIENEINLIAYGKV